MIRPTKNIKVKIKLTGSITGKLNGSTIVVEPELENLEVTPSIEEQVFKSKKYGFDKVKVNGITAEIDEDIKPENIKAGINILGVEGGYEGVDTSDATATVGDIASGKTAYVNGEKIEGTVETITGSKPMSAENVFDFGGSVAMEAINEESVLFKKNSKMLVAANYDKFVKAIKLTSDKIVEGNTVLGVSGSVKIPDTSDATALSEDILQDKTAYVNNEKITGTMQEYDGGYTGNGETGNEWEENFISSIDNSLGARITRLPDKLTSVGQYAFYKSKIAITELPNKITSIEKSAFEDCIYLLISKLPDTIKTLSSNCFKNCSKITISELPIGLTSIPESCFHGCSNVSVSRVPDGVTFIGSSAFRGCNEITSFELPSSITTINNNVFYNCNRMTTFKALGDITSFGSYVFNGATALERVELPNITSVPKLGNNQVFYNTLIANGKGYIYVPDNLVEEIKTATYWSTLANQIKPISELEV